MLKAKIFTVYVFVKSLFCTCDCDVKDVDFAVERGKKNYQISRIDKLSDDIKESSALVVDHLNDGKILLWTLRDSGGEPVLYKVNIKGELIETIPVPDATNIDWEALARDPEGNFYIGDFGNNKNDRKNLRIYKFNPKTSQTSVIRFSYPDQSQFPPPAEDMNFDAESLIWFKKNLYIVSKNRGDDLIKLYKLPDTPGNYTAEITDTVRLSGMITDAAISPDSTTLALASYGKMYLFGINGGNPGFEKPLRCIPFARSGQSEGIGFINNTDLLLTNENRKIFYVNKKRSE